MLEHKVLKNIKPYLKNVKNLYVECHSKKGNYVMRKCNAELRNEQLKT